jgi:membrane protein YqaA with SNARE-associated domain
MARIVDWAQELALSLGAPGLYVVAFLDSSFLSLPEINDLLVVWMVTRHKSRMVLYSTAATLGSISGCLVLYAIGRKGGEALVLRRFDAARTARALALFQRYGVLAIIVPSLLPPPMPFKIFVLTAGVTRVPLARFVAAVGVGRGTRYFGEGLLALRYGDQTMTFIHEHTRALVVALLLLTAVGLAAYLVWSKAQAAKSR